MPHGHKHSEETKRKISESLKGRKASPEARKKMSIAQKGNKNSLGNRASEETKLKMSNSHKGKKKPPLSAAHRKKISKGNLGKKRTEEAKRKYSAAKRGKKNSSWRGGISYVQYGVDWTETLRRSIRERDHYVCRMCGKPQGDKAHHVHHIDYDKQNCNPQNLITLCRNCHQKTSFKREYWKKYLREVNHGNENSKADDGTSR